MSVRVRDLTGDWRVAWAGEAEAGRRFRDFDEALRFVSRWRHDPLTVTALRALLAQRELAWGALRDEALVARCAQLLAQGRLRCVRIVPLRVDDIARQEGDAHDTLALDEFLPDEARKTWIEIELTDMEGNPMAGERYWIELPDGTVREGALNAQGRAYFGGLDPGEALIRWPDLDDEAVVVPLVRQGAPPPPTPPPPPPPTLTWIEVELRDMEGAPIPFEPYWIELPDGTVHEGRLDAYGRVRFDEILPGEALIRWPALDEEAAVLTQPSASAPAASAAPALPPEASRTWIEAVLVDMDGQPMPGERYRITLPDGTAREGRLDAYGRVRLEPVDAGEAVIVWPDLDAEAVAELGP